MTSLKKAKLKGNLIYFIIAAIILIQLPSGASGFYAPGDGARYEGVAGYRGIQKNISYQDISNSWAKPSIYKLAALDIMKGTEKKFNPKAKVSRRQALEILGRALDIKTDDYVEYFSGTNIIPDDEFEEIASLPREREEQLLKSIKKQIKDGELSKEEGDKVLAREKEKYTWGRNATREEIASWLARGLGLTKTSPYIVNSFKDHSNFTLERKDIVEAALQAGYMQGFKDNYFRPKNPITREELAKTIDNALDDLIKQTDMEVKMGRVSQVKEVNIVEGQTLIKKKVYHMANTDGSYPIISISESGSNYLNKGFLVYKGGRLGLSANLRTGDTIKYYIDKNGLIIYSEITDIW